MQRATLMVYDVKRFPLRVPACLAVLLVAAAGAPLWAAGFGEATASEAPAEAKTAPKRTGPSPEEQRALHDIETAFAGGDYDKAITLAKDFVRSAESEALKTEAARIVAKSQRKKKEWGLAQGAYLSLRNRFEKGSDEFVRLEAVAEILRASRDGVYYPLVQSGNAEDAGTLDDDAVLEKALATLAQNRAKRVELRLPRLRRARSVEEIVQRFVGVAEEIAQLQGIWPEMSPSLARAAVQAAAMRLAPLSKKTIAALRDKSSQFQVVLQERGLNSSRQSEMRRYKALCEKLAAAEQAFLDAMDELDGTRDWPEGQTLREEAEKRRADYEKLATDLTLPERPDRGNRGGRGREWSGRGPEGNRY